MDGDRAPEGMVFISSEERPSLDKPEVRRFHRVDHVSSSPWWGDEKKPWKKRLVTRAEAEALGFTPCNHQNCMTPEERSAYLPCLSEEAEARHRSRTELRDLKAEVSRLEDPRHRLIDFFGRRWNCSCGARGHYQRDGDATAAAYKWMLNHYMRVVGVKVPREYEDWMPNKTAGEISQRAADIQRSYHEGRDPIYGRYPWSQLEEEAHG